MSCNLFRIENVKSSALEDLSKATRAPTKQNSFGDSILNIDVNNIRARMYLAEPEEVLVGQVTSKPETLSCEEVVNEIKSFLNVV
jgi:hypothetical protein